MRSARPALAALLASVAAVALPTPAGAAPLPATTFDAPGAGEPALASGDFDGDGIQDLATPSGGSELTVLPGLGGGDFGVPETIVVPTADASLAVGDFDADGVDDLVVVGRRLEPEGGTLSILRGTPAGLELGDELDVDGSIGKPFVADLGSSASDDLLLRLGDRGTKAFAGGPGGIDLDAPQTTSLPPGVIAVGDFGGDIGTALVTDTYDADGNQALIWTGDLESGFAVSVSRRLGNATYGFGQVNDALVADVDGDGLGELMITVGHPALGTRLAVIWSDAQTGLAAGREEYGIRTADPDYDLPGEIAVSDFDGDGAQDVAVAAGARNGTSGLLGVLRGTDDQAFEPSVSFEVPPGFAGLLAGADVLGSPSELAAPTTDAVSVVDIADALADDEPPETSIEGAPYVDQRSRAVSIDERADDPLASFECALDGGEFRPCGAWFTDLPRGPHTIAVRAVDQLGNVDPTPASVAVDVEWAPPNTEIKPQPVVGRRLTVALRSDVDRSRFRCALDRGALRPCGERMTFRRLSKGRHVLRAVAIDPMGLRDRTPAIRSFRVR